jgi:UDP-N-acetylglucosamine--N-acetylmuramyl-(pentapeptide) pyrophosphoryl-undecaprenol N-acetylglucosamine transferase
MHIVLTGGGTGGHFYPLIAVAEAVRAETAKNRMLAPSLTYIAPDPYDAAALFAAGIEFKRASAGKLRRYMSLQNLIDPFRVVIGVVQAFLIMLKQPPDVVFSKGGFASVPTVLAARLLAIPVVIHESDSRPGRATLLAARFATRIAVSFESAVGFFPERKRAEIALTGTPIRTELLKPLPEGAVAELGLDPEVPTVLILGGSSGSTRINETVIAALPALVEKVNVIHQTGTSHLAGVTGVAEVVLRESPHKARYHAFGFLGQEAMRMAAGAATVVVSRAGATAISEIAAWRKPTVLIPIPESVSHDQRSNAYAYAHAGGAVVLEEENLTPNLLVSEVTRIAGDPAAAARMATAGVAFANPQAAALIAHELIRIGISHLPSIENP